MGPKEWMRLERSPGVAAAQTRHVLLTRSPTPRTISPGRRSRAPEERGGDLARPAPLGDPDAAAMPVAAEYVRTSDREPLWVVLSTRRAPEVLENPYWRGRLVDMSYTARTSQDPLPGDVRALLDAVIAALTSAEEGCGAASELLARLPAALGVIPPGAGWSLQDVRRIEAEAPAEEEFTARAVVD